MSSTAICGSDLHLLDGYVPTMQSGDVLGHPTAGIFFKNKQDNCEKAVLQA